MEEMLPLTLQAKQELPDYEDDSSTELKPDVLDIYDTKNINVLSGVSPGAEEVMDFPQQIIVKIEGEDEDKAELQSRFLLSTTSHMSDRGLEAIQFVDPADVPDTSTSLVKEEDIDPLFDLKEEPHTWSSEEDVIINASTVRKLSTAPLTRPYLLHLQRLENHCDPSMKIQQLSLDGPLQSLSCDAGMLLAVPSVEQSARGTNSTLQPNTSKHHGDGPAEPEQRPQHVERKFYCVQCLKGLRDNGHLSVPLERNPIDHSNKCAGCLKMFSTKKHWTANLVEPVRNIVFQCYHCDKTFRCKSHLKSHITFHSRERPHHCSQCKKSFKHSSSLRIHMKLHIGEPNYQCSKCDNCFTDSYLLSCHRQTHSGVCPYQCSHCDKTFILKSHLNKHTSLHTEEHVHHCSQCDKRFRLKRELDLHLRRHSGVRLFECSQCDKSFTHLSSLRRHIGMNTGVSSHKCSKCDKSFTCKSYLKVHIISHTADGPHHCSQCDKIFRLKCYLNRHMKRHSATDTSPALCGAQLQLNTEDPA